MAKMVKVYPLPDQPWPCENCERRDCVAIVKVPRVEETHGYCARCLGPAVAAELK